MLISTGYQQTRHTEQFNEINEAEDSPKSQSSPNSPSSSEFQSVASSSEDITKDSTFSTLNTSNDTDHKFGSLPDDEVCQVSGLTGREKKLIWASWRLVTLGERYITFCTEFVSLVYLHLPYFPDRFMKRWIDSGTELTVDLFLTHVEGVVIQEINCIISDLHSPETFKKRVTYLSTSHLAKSPKVGAEEFEPFFKNFHRLMIKCLEESSTHELVKLWTKLMGVIFQIIKNEEDGTLVQKQSDKVGSETQTQGCCCSLM